MADHDRALPFHAAIEKYKKEGRREICFFTIPAGFANNAQLLEYWRGLGYRAEIVDGTDGYGILHISW